MWQMIDNVFFLSVCNYWAEDFMMISWDSDQICRSRKKRNIGKKSWNTILRTRIRNPMDQKLNRISDVNWILRNQRTGHFVQSMPPNRYQTSSKISSMTFWKRNRCSQILTLTILNSIPMKILMIYIQYEWQEQSYIHWRKHLDTTWYDLWSISDSSWTFQTF